MKKFMAIILSSCLLVSLFTACKKSPEATNTAAKSSTVAPKTTGTASTSTPASSAASTAAASSTSSTAEKIPASAIGKPYDKATSVFKDVFAGDANSPDATLTLANDKDEIVKFAGGTMTMSVNNVDAWATYTVNEAYAVGSDIKQNEFSVDFKTSHKDSATSPWMALFVGCKVTGDSIANAGTGFWVAFTDQTTAAVFPGVTSVWPAGAPTKVTLPVSLSAKHTITIVDNGDNFYYFIKDDSGNQWLILSAKLDGTNITVKDHDGKEVYSGATEVINDGQFKLFNHMGQTEVSKIEVKQS